MGQPLPTTRVVLPNGYEYRSPYGCVYSRGSGYIGEVKVPVSVRGVITQVYVILGAAPGTDEQIKVRVYGNSSNIELTLSDTDTYGTARGMIVVTPGDVIYIRTYGSTGAAAYIASVALVFWTETNTESHMSGSGEAAYNNYTYYTALMGWNEYGGSLTEVYEEFIAADSCTISELRVRVEDAPGAGNSWAFTLRKNGEDTTLTATISGTSKEASDTEHEVDVSAGDTISIEVVPTSDPNDTEMGFSIKVDTGVANNFLVGAVTESWQVFDEDEYAPAIGRDYSHHGNYHYRALVSEDMTITKMYVELDTAPGAGKSRTVTLVKYSGGEETLTALAVTISDTATTGNAASSISFSKGDYFYLKWDKSGTPASCDSARIGLLANTNPVAPTVTTDSVKNGTGTGTISAIGDGSSCSVRGFCYKEATSGDPNIFDDTIVVDGDDQYEDGEFATGEYSLALGLEEGKLYRVRAFAVNDNEVAYGTTLAAYFTYPTDTMARVSSIRRVYRPGLYRMELALGDLGFDVEVSEAAIKRVPDEVTDTSTTGPEREIMEEQEALDRVIKKVTDYEKWMMVEYGGMTPNQAEQILTAPPLLSILPGKPVTPTTETATNVAKQVWNTVGSVVYRIQHPMSIVQDVIKGMIGWFS